MTLTEFLAARLDEDERELIKDPPKGLGYANLAARMRREIEAKRKILALHHAELIEVINADGGERSGYFCAECADLEWPCPTVRLEIAAWSDHPYYDEAWRP